MGQVQRYFEDHFELDGATLKIKSTALSSSGLVVDTRAILTTGPGLTGGGDLTADRTIALAWTSTAPAALGVASSGSSGYPSRSDHVHALPTPGAIGAAVDAAVVHLAGTETVTGNKTVTGTLELRKVGIGIDPSALPGDAIAFANASSGVVFRNSGDSAFLRAVGWSGNHVLVGDNSCSGVQYRSGSAAPHVVYVNNVEMLRVDNVAVTLPTGIPLSLKDGGGSAREVLKSSGSTLVINGPYLTAAIGSLTSLAFEIEDSGPYTPLELFSDSAVLANATPLSARTSTNAVKQLAVVDAGDVAVFGGPDLETRINASSELVLGLDGATPSAPTVRGGSATGTDTQAADLGLSPGVSTGNATPAVIELFVTVPGASGSSPQTQQSGVVVSEPGNDEVALLVRLKRGSTPALERVLVGAADSAGTGFRALCVPN